jgi:hypothetical protein
VDRPLVRQVDLARPEVRNFAYRVFLPFVFNLTGQRSARLQERLVNSNRSSSNLNNNLPLIQCLAALVQIPVQHRQPVSVRRTSGFEISYINHLTFVLSGGAFGQTPSNTASVFGAPKPATGFGATGTFGTTGFGSTTATSTTGAFGQPSTSTTGAFGNTGIFGNKPAFGTSEHVPSIVRGYILTFL